MQRKKSLLAYSVTDGILLDYITHVTSSQIFTDTLKVIIPNVNYSNCQLF